RGRENAVAGSSVENKPRHLGSYGKERCRRTECRPFHCSIRKCYQPPATIFTISSRSPALSSRFENSDGATASPLCSTTTLRGSNPCATRNSSMVHGNLAVISRPFAVTSTCFIGVSYPVLNRLCLRKFDSFRHT